MLKQGGMGKVGVLASALIVAAGLGLGAVQRPPSTALVIYAVDPVAGTAVRLSSAEVYVDVWGHGETYQIKPEGSAVRIPLNPGWQCSVDRTWCEGLFTFDARITIRADGYESVTSNHFAWLKTAPDETSIQFPGTRTARLRVGVTGVMTIPLRRPLARRVRVLDPAGSPVIDARVTIRGLLARTNHCAFPEGEQLFDGHPGADGSIALPEGQREFAIGIFKPRHRSIPRARYGWIEGRFDAQESIIRIEPLDRRTLRMDLRNPDGTPAEAEVIGSWAEGCMSPGVSIGKSDREGHVTISDFYPEEFSDVGVLWSGRQVWLFDPRKEQWAGRRVFYLKP